MTRIWTLLAVVALTTVGCEVPNPLYCDGDTRTCTDPQRPYCNVPARQCQPAPDGGAADAGPVTDGGDADGADAADGGPVQDAGADATSDAQADAASTDATADGPAPAQDASVDAGPCTATSCPDSLPICGAGGVCRACASHTECEQRDGTKPVCILQQCRPSVCGDGYTDLARGEVCDDGNTDNGDGCDPTCRWTGTVTTIAGKATSGGYCDDVGVDARIAPRYAAIDGSAVFFTDGDTIRKMILPSYAVTRFAGSMYESGTADGSAAAARFSAPTGIASDGTFLYVADAGNYTIRRMLIADGSTATIAGAAGQSGTADDATSGLNARFSQLAGLAWFKNGSTNALYILDGCAIRKVNLDLPNFPVSTLAGVVNGCGWTDGGLASARFAGPQGITAGGYGEIYVADTGNHVIRKIDASQVTTLCGAAGQPGSADGTGGAARFKSPAAITYSALASSLFVADQGNFTVRQVGTDGVVNTLAGAAGLSGTADGSGTAARFRGPAGLAAGSNTLAGDLLVPDGDPFRGDGRTFRRVTETGTVTTVAGAPVLASTTSIDGTGASARFSYPWGLAVALDGLYVTDHQTCLLRHLSLGDLSVSTIAGTANHCTMSDGTGAAASFLNPLGLLAGPGSVYVVDSGAIREYVTGTSAVLTRAGSTSPGIQDGNGFAAGFAAARHIASDGTYLYVSDSGTIRRLTIGSPWTVATILGQPGLWGGLDGSGTSARLGVQMGVVVIGTTLYVADPLNSALRAVDLSVQPYTITTVAGLLGAIGTNDGLGPAARFTFPSSLAWDDTSLFVLDAARIRQVDLATMRVTTLAGRSDCLAVVDGDHTRAAFNATTSLVYSPTTGHLYVADTAEDVIREIR
ncbi:MAG TPA: hypothetical protein VGQ83_30305 [Polyangia bacterium]|jgi:cysteine-rich repeat protein